MTNANEAARVRWLVAGAFSPRPAGRAFEVDAARFSEAMQAAGLALDVTVPDRLRGAGTRTFHVTFAGPRDFQLADVIARLPELAALRGLAEDLADAGRRPAPEAALERARAAAGDGSLLEALRGALLPAAPAAPEPPRSDDPVEAMFEKAQTKVERPIKGAIDAFVRSNRPQGGAAAAAAPARAARDLVEAAVYGTARDVLADPEVARLEAAWRGLKLIADQCTAKAGMVVRVLDVAPPGAAAALEAALPADLSEMPEAMLVADPCDDAAVLGALADLGEGAQVPVVATVTPAFFGCAGAGEVALEIEREGGGVREAFGKLREEERSRWLCVAANRVVVAAEGAGAARRAVFASAALAVGGLLAASYRDTGTFARILGAPGGLKAPGTHTLGAGPESGSAAPTEAFFSIRAQARAASLGVLALGSARNGDKVLLSIAPMARASADAVPLPAQILSGRIVRFARWVREQVPAGASDEDVATLYGQASQVFLFPGADTAVATLAAKVHRPKDGPRLVHVEAAVSPQHAGIPLRLEFALPL